VKGSTVAGLKVLSWQVPGMRRKTVEAQIYRVIHEFWK